MRSVNNWRLFSYSDLFADANFLIMRLLPLSLVNFLLILTAGCSHNPRVVNHSTPKATTSSTQLIQNSIAIKNSISTKPLRSKPIRININNLPKPFDSTSSSKPPQILPIPANPTLRLPPGFVVNVFAEGLDAPRWLALTPSGDVLVTETRQNRISLLRDSNGDGVADEKKDFCNRSQWIKYTLWHDFWRKYFLLG